MGKNRQNPPNPSPTRDEQRQFAADKFKWLRQVALNPAYPPLASRFAILLLRRFNLEYDGDGWASQDTLATEIGCRREAINRWFTLFVKHGDLTYKRGGWGDTNCYRMVIKEEVTDVRLRAHQEQTEEPTDVRADAHSDVRRRAHNLLLTNQGDASHPPLEREAATAAPDGGPSSYRRPPHREKKGKRGCGGAIGNNNAPPLHAEELAALRGVWERAAHAVKDNKPAAVKAQHRALDGALQNVSFDVVLAAAKTYAAAYDAENNGRRFLNPLEDWLGAKGWEKPPPKRSKANNGHAGGNGHWPRRKPKSSTNHFYEEAGFEPSADGNIMRETKGRTH